VGLAGAILLLMGLGGWVQWRQSSLMSEAMLVSGDNLAHFLYQADNEYLRLRETLPGEPRSTQALSIEALQLRYDIFVSRIEVLRIKGKHVMRLSAQASTQVFPHTACALTPVRPA
jgi:hypothetical protein